MKKHRLAVAVVVGALFPAPLLHAELPLEMLATITSATCELEISNGGIINLSTVKLDYFTSGMTAEQNIDGGEDFSIKVKGCTAPGENSLFQLHLQFMPKNGVFAAGSQQIFPNEETVGAENVGIVIFSAVDHNNMFNVWSPGGQSRSIYSVTADKLVNSSWTFYTRMQQVNALQTVSAGKVSTSVLVDASYN
ncbi:fimbrial protein [Escherichia ruysiae]|uniref:fimbrial-like protein n=1 Tax=Escherichia ruysiae TaxID=2608867 RepID=UPI0017D5E3ED|nr:fimbrial-like protein [Escherichia ruysiae]EFC1526191.1 fimbrial protein [Escherichia coli]EFC9526720.1 fimbrial protein [Escherichia coli]MBY7384128.1 fimbrial protein [Escherichia ruysiae]MBY7433583.1 fimbrial protein [Escherichia ruysiae]MEC9877179.1 fimbrial-like protein [Escherichia ruysiae]